MTTRTYKNFNFLQKLIRRLNSVQNITRLIEHKTVINNNTQLVFSLFNLTFARFTISCVSATQWSVLTLSPLEISEKKNSKTDRPTNLIVLM